MAEVRLKIENLENTHGECIPVLNKLFLDYGIKPFDPEKQMKYWSVKLEEGQEDYSLINEPVLSVDKSGNELRAVFFVTRKKRSKTTVLYRFTELFADLDATEKNTTIQEALEEFLVEKPEYRTPISVLLLGKLQEDGKEYAGCFMYNIAVPVPIDPTVIEPELKHIKKIRKKM